MSIPEPMTSVKNPSKVEVVSYRSPAEIIDRDRWFGCRSADILKSIRGEADAGWNTKRPRDLVSFAKSDRDDKPLGPMLAWKTFHLELALSWKP